MSFYTVALAGGGAIGAVVGGFAAHLLVHRRAGDPRTAPVGVDLRHPRRGGPLRARRQGSRRWSEPESLPGPGLGCRSQARGTSRRARASAASSRCTSSACRLLSNCSMVRGPTIGPVTPGCASSQARPTAAGCSPSFVAERLVALDLSRCSASSFWVASDADRPVSRCLREDAAEQPAHQRAPRDDADAVVPRRGDHLLLDVALDEVVQALLADEPEEVPGSRQSPAPGRSFQPAKFDEPT